MTSPNNLTDREVLEQVISRAIEGGYVLVKNHDWIWRVGDSVATGLCISIVPDIKKTGLITYISHPIDYERVVFNHDFAKALWGEEKTYQAEVIRSPEEGAVGYDQYYEEWEYHLTNMVLEERPIDYLRQYLKENE